MPDERFVQRTACSAPYPDQCAEENPLPLSPASLPSDLHKDGRLWRTVFILSLIPLLILLLLSLQVFRHHSAFLARKLELSGSRFAEGIRIDGLPVGGLTWEAACEIVSRHAAAPPDLRLVLQADSIVLTITNETVNRRNNWPDVLSAAFALGRSISPALPASVTPFEYRFRTLQTVREKGAEYSTEAVYDREALIAVVDTLASMLEKDAVNAQVLTDTVTGERVFTDEIPGAKLDRDTLVQQLSKLLDRGEDACVVITTEPVLPEITRVELMNMTN